MSDFVPRLLVGGRYLDLKWVGNKWSIMRRFAASSALLKLAAALFLLATLWMSYEYLLSRSVPGSGGRAARASLEEERRCLYRQGLNPAADGHLADNDTYSQFFCGADRYPAGLCTVHLAYFSHGERRFVAKVKELYESRMNNQLSSRMWPVRASSQGWPRCTQYFDEAFVFDVDNSISDDLYFQLHMKSLIPLYSLLALRKHLGPPPAPGYSVVLLPAVEDYSLKVRHHPHQCPVYHANLRSWLDHGYGYEVHNSMTRLCCVHLVLHCSARACKLGVKSFLLKPIRLFLYTRPKVYQ